VPLVISDNILAKIGGEDHGGLTRKDIEECFENHMGKYCLDNRPQHADRNGNPPRWFVSETNHQRKIKIMYVRDGNTITLLSAYPATEEVERIFNKFCQ